MNLLQKFEQKILGTLANVKVVPQFRAGDSVKVGVKIVEGTTERVQAFEGVVISKRNRGVGSTFTVRKISNGEGVERTFLTNSPRVEYIEVTKHGKVRRSKLYYMRSLQGKAARIEERMQIRN